ncbi:probable receptor-like protein kinase At2g42960 [Pyrus communis]|uniref:probable receptor-like protein kinase At2g42960 n=1 Tax=Pyrus communis TaxID=23211 RepID=UPI0035C16F6E
MVAELRRATKDFSPEMIIGGGSFGLVYRGLLSNGMSVAVKKCNAVGFPDVRAIRAEEETLGKVQHPHIIKLLGHCQWNSTHLLFYEYYANRDLYSWLHDESRRWAVSSWETRFRIVKGVADGLAYLHGLDNPIIHRDIKSENVILDSNFEPHIAHFGLARWMEASHTHVTTEPDGSVGYIPPEYLAGSNKATTKGDVYSFGILMLEIATRRRLAQLTTFDAQKMEVVEWVKMMVANYIVDPSNPNQQLVAVANLSHYFKIAWYCVINEPQYRPHMKWVVERLNEIR